MPKVIANLPELLLTRAREALLEEGYAHLSIRGIARRCGIAVGTVYNYYRSKDLLVASVLAEDWRGVINRAEAACARAESFRQGLEALYGEIAAFAARYERVFSESGFSGAVRYAYAGRHQQLRGQVEAVLRELARRLGRSAGDFTPLFAAEAVVCWATEGRCCEDVAPLLDKLF